MFEWIHSQPRRPEFLFLICSKQKKISKLGWAARSAIWQSVCLKLIFNTQRNIMYKQKIYNIPWILTQLLWSDTVIGLFRSPQSQMRLNLMRAGIAELRSVTQESRVTTDLSPPEQDAKVSAGDLSGELSRLNWYAFWILTFKLSLLSIYLLTMEGVCILQVLKGTTCLVFSSWN